jgi:arsenate reductase (thioredoxin)
VGTRLHWPFEDPAAAVGSEEEKLTKFRLVRDAIEAKIQEWLAEFDSLHSIYV